MSSPPPPTSDFGGSALDFAQVVPSFRNDRSFLVSPLVVSPAARMSLGPACCLPCLRVVPSSRLLQAQEYHPKREAEWRAHSYLEKGMETLEPGPPTPSLPPSSCRASSPCLSAPPVMSLSCPHGKWGCSNFGLSTLTLAGGPRPTGAEASRAGTVKGARRVVTTAWPAGRWLLGTLIHILFTRRAPEASRAHTAERARQVLTDPSAAQARALDALIHICSEQGMQVIQP